MLLLSYKGIINKHIEIIEISAFTFSSNKQVSKIPTIKTSIFKVNLKEIYVKKLLNLKKNIL